jgi:glycosyltransferase involved in cell wall biosynthesis
MRVLHLTRDFPPRAAGGISTAVGGLAAASQRAGLAVSVISFDAWRPTRFACGGATAERSAEGIAVLRVTGAAQLNAAAAFARAQRPHLLHVHHGMLWAFAASLARALGVPALKTVHVVQRRMNALRGTGERTRSLAGQEQALAEASRIIVPSRAVAEALLAGDAGLAARLRVAPHGIDDSAGARAAVAARASANSGRTVLHVGRFDCVKGTAELFTALVQLLADRPAAAAVIAGGVPENRRAERRWLQRWQRLAPPALRARADFVGWLTPEVLQAHYRTATLLLVASRFETFGLAALEAMLHGVPVVASAAGGLTELVRDGETGFLVPSGAPQALAARAVELLDQPSRALQLGQAAAVAVRQQHLWPRALPAITAVYRELV